MEKHSRRLYAELWATCPAGEGHATPEVEAVSALASHVANLTQQAGLHLSLQQLGVSQESLPGLAAAAADQWTGNFNPRQLGPAELLTLYTAAY